LEARVATFEVNVYRLAVCVLHPIDWVVVGAVRLAIRDAVRGVIVAGLTVRSSNAK
jgi:hypothetical protein